MAKWVLWVVLAAWSACAVAADAASQVRPGYVLVDDAGRYSYEPAPSADDRAAGRVVKPLVMFAYAGMREGAHQLLVIGDAELRSSAPRELQVFAWRPGEKFVRQSLYWHGKLQDAKTVRALPSSLIASAMQDADRGMLKRYVHKPQGGPKRGVWVYCDERKGCGAEPVR